MIIICVSHIAIVCRFWKVKNLTCEQRKSQGFSLCSGSSSNKGLASVQDISLESSCNEILINGSIRQAFHHIHTDGQKGLFTCTHLEKEFISLVNPFLLESNHAETCVITIDRLNNLSNLHACTKKKFLANKFFKEKDNIYIHIKVMQKSSWSEQQTSLHRRRAIFNACEVASVMSQSEPLRIEGGLMILPLWGV